MKFIKVNAYSQLDANYSNLTVAIAIANVSSIVFSYLVSVLSLDRILISDIIVADLFMHSFSDIILLYLATPFLHCRRFWMRISWVFISTYVLLA